MYTNMNLLDVDVHYLPFFQTHDLIINNAPHLSIENQTSLYEDHNIYNNFFMNRSLEKNEECSMIPPFLSNKLSNNTMSSSNNNHHQPPLTTQDHESNTQLNNHEIYSRVRWTREEENELIKIIKKIGAKKWNKVAEHMKNRTAKQCRDHYANCLNPDIKKSLWTIEEEKILIEKYKEYGTRWSMIKRYLPGRTTSMIKNYMRMILKSIENKKSHKGLNIEYSELMNDLNEESSSYSANNTGSDNDDHSLSLQFENNQEKYNDFDYHSIVCLLN